MSETNKYKYRFDDFTLKNYAQLLDIAIDQGYVFGDYNLEFPKTRELAWRHDVEFSVHRALKMAKLEAERGIKAHYFFQLHSGFYNIFEKEIYQLAKEIIDLRHYIGLHFDAHFWEIEDENQLERCLTIDKTHLETLLEVEIQSFSYHNTTPALLNMNEIYYAGMLNVYAKQIREKYRYCTDSTGIWRFERLEDVLRDKSIQCLQVLTHDGMWQDEPMAPRQRVLRSINMRAKRIQEYYDKFLPEVGQLNIDED